MKNKVWTMGLSFLMMVGCALSDGATWGTDYEAACKQAKETQRPILIDFTGSDWCGWCIKLDKEVFDLPAFKAYAKDNLVLLKLDFPRRKKLKAELVKQNEKLMEQFGVRGFPTILLVNADGKELARTGYQSGGAKAYVEHLKALLKDGPVSAKR